jgi:hypothetical protein
MSIAFNRYVDAIKTTSTRTRWSEAGPLSSPDAQAATAPTSNASMHGRAAEVHEGVLRPTVRRRRRHYRATRLKALPGSPFHLHQT